MKDLLKNPIFTLAVLLLSVVAFIVYRIHIVDTKMSEGGQTLYIENDTDFALRVYAHSEKKHITRTLQARTMMSYGPFLRNIGQKGSEVVIRSKRWDRPIAVEFKGKDHMFSKRVMVDRRKKRMSGRTITLQVETEWPLFREQDGYTLRITQISDKELPNFANLVAKFFTS